jgi:hypothetical protein
LFECETLIPQSLLRPREIRFGLLDNSEVVTKVAIPKDSALIALFEQVAGVLADRLEHPVAWPELGLALAQKALVEERLESIRVGTGDLLCGLVAAAANEDGEASEELLLRLCQEVV